MVLSMAAVMSPASEDPTTKAASPIFGVTIPQGYRQWELIAPAEEADPLNELRAVVGNAIAITAYGNATLPFPDGTILVKLAWKHLRSPEYAPASVPGAATTVQIMVKDSTQYAATGGWGFGRFIDGKPVDEAQQPNLLRVSWCSGQRPRLRLHPVCTLTIDPGLGRERSHQP